MSERRDDRDGVGRAYPLVLPEVRPSLLRRVARPLIERWPHRKPPRDASVPRDGAVVAPEPTPETGRPPETSEAVSVDSGPMSRLTLQLLPGRLQPVDPEVMRQEVRFLKERGRHVVVVLGWAEGDPPGHVTLDHPSVEPEHARMTFTEGRWSIESLSNRNPVKVNGMPVPFEARPRLLKGDDRVRLGDVEFRFRWP